MSFADCSNAGEWRDVPGYEGLYQVSSLGKIRNAKGHVLKDRIAWTGYNRVVLSKDGVQRDYSVHRIVMAAFVGPLPDGKEVNHLNGVRADNRVINLEYVTRRENLEHNKKLGTWPAGEKNGRAKLSPAQVSEIRARRAAGEKLKPLAAEYGVHKNTIWWAVTGGTWQQAA